MPFLLQSQTTFLTSRLLPISQLLPSAGYAPADLATLIPAVFENAVGVPFAFAKTSAGAAVIAAT